MARGDSTEQRPSGLPLRTSQASLNPRLIDAAEAIARSEIGRIDSCRPDASTTPSGSPAMARLLPLVDTLRALLAMVVCGLLGAMGNAPAGTILVSDWSSNTVGEWSTTGALVNTSLVTGLNQPNGVASTGDYVFVANQQGNTVGKYTSTGQLVDASFITGLSSPTQLLVSGTSLYVMNNGTSKIGKYDTTTGAAVNASFVTLTDSSPFSMAISGTSLFVVAESTGHSENSFVVEYSTTDGAFLADVIPSLPGAATGFYGLAASGQSLYVSFYYNNGFISEYSTSGTLVNAKLIDGLIGPQNIVVTGSSLYVLEIGANNKIGEYTTSGQTVNASLVSGLSNARNFTVVTVPEPSTGLLLVLGAAGMLLMARGRGASGRARGGHAAATVGSAESVTG